MTGVSQAPQWLLDAVREELGRRCALRSEEVNDALLYRAIEQASENAGASSVEQFVTSLRADTDRGGTLLQHLLRKVTVGETTFFRHAEDLDWLRRAALPQIVARREAAGIKRLRLWSAGCASGEEAYSLAALAIEAVPDPAAWDIEVLGTDINDNSLAAARQAEYGPWSFRGVEQGPREIFFESAGGDRLRPIESVRKRVTFTYLNLRDPLYPAVFTGTTGLDVICCRNVFIYFYPDRIAESLERFQGCLSEDGVLLCGPSDLFHVKANLPLFRAEKQAPHRMRRVSPTDEAESPTVRRPLHTPLPIPRPSLPLRPSPSRPGVAVSGAGSGLKAILADLAAGRYPEACIAATSALEKDSLSIELTRCLALGLAGRGHAPEAIEAWRRLLYLDPADTGAHLSLGLLLLHEPGGRPAARRHFQNVLSLLETTDDSAILPGPDAIPAGWVRATCRSLVRGPV